MTINIETGFEAYSEAIEWRYNNPKSNMGDYFTSKNMDMRQFFDSFKAWAGIGFEAMMQSLQIKSVKAIFSKQSVSNYEKPGNNIETFKRNETDLPRIIKMTPDEYSKPNSLKIMYHSADCKFGKILVASTVKGICFLSLGGDNQQMLNELKLNYPYATFTEQHNETIDKAIGYINTGNTSSGNVILHLKCTPFQLKVWECLLQIPRGGLTTYAAIAKLAGFPNAHRAVGTAVGSNPVSLLIPCHRVVCSTGKLGQYRWGAARKKATIGWEIANSK